MEKSIAHYPLDEIKERVLVHGLRAFTQTASDNARLMGLDRVAAVSVVLGLKREMLFKSMTTHADHRVWQDVYYARCPNGKTAYIKVTIQAGATVIQFKEK
ncbi:MAG: type II toxin-antitoxin system MqsR family toxin [Rhodoferax sp.]|nr:type II toxin-antitoxin system MqsR family toxin [Rhodoferax sp.]